MTGEAPVVVEVIRGGARESRHRGEAVVVDASGKIRFRSGNPHRMVFARSAAKPLQAMTVVESGALRQFGFSPAELAVMCGSHGGEPRHCETVRGILDKIGLGVESLACGSHPPADAASALALVKAGRAPEPLHNNCSGKHAGMLAVCRRFGWPAEGYLAPDHPVQHLNLLNLASMIGVEPSDIHLGVDGCGAPAYASPLSALALAYARMAAPSDLPSAKAEAARAVADAMRSHPDLVAGTGRLCTRLMSLGKGLIAKSGAEGVYCVGLIDPGWGLALKVEDGSSRAVPPVAIHLLEQIGALDRQEIDRLADLHEPALRDHRGNQVGCMKPVAHLDWAGGEGIG
ncbi:MAG TPA: asparaginase [Bacillota bacterium]|nr:asparaginase [Bacillota bacterium]